MTFFARPVFPAAKRFISTPRAASWGDEITADGSDFCNELYTHRYTAYLFQPRDAADDSAREALQSVLDANGIRFTRQPRIFYEDLQLFCTTYTFDVVERRLI